VTADYEAVVYDLDGTLVRLAVDWDEVTTDAASVLSARGVDTDGMDLWDILERADAEGLRGTVESTIADHEREGARTSRRLRLATALTGELPVAVCSLNCEAACRIALEIHGLDSHVDAIVGRDTVDGHKPDPEPLLAAVRGLSVAPERALFVGDSERDEVTARRAGVPFEYADDHRPAG